LETRTLEEKAADELWDAYRATAAGLRWSDDVLTCRLALPPSQAFRLCEAAGSMGQDPVVWSHGTGAAYWSVQAASDREGAESVRNLRLMATEFGGALVVENRPALLGPIDVWGPIGSSFENMKSIKSQFDPRGTLNPGRLRSIERARPAHCECGSVQGSF
jgi:hypothetical protein